MKALFECIYARGEHGFKYVRCRIPAAIRASYPAHQEHILRRLGASDLREAKERARTGLARIDAEFRLKRAPDRPKLSCPPRGAGWAQFGPGALKSQQLDLSRASLAARRAAKLDDD